MASGAGSVLPVGFRFRPTDEELVRHYLKAKIAGRAHPDLLLIPDVDLATCEPWDLPAKSVIKSDDPEWFFFAPRDRPKYPGRHRSNRSNRSTAAGYWKATGKDRLIRSRPAGTLIGMKKTLVFHRGRAPRGHRTAWIMHEYRTTEPHFESGQNGSFVLYRLFNKQEDETPGSNSEVTMPPSTSSQGNYPQNDDGAVQAATASIIKDSTSPSDLSQLTAIKIATDDADHSIAHLLTTVDDKEQTEDKEYTEAQEDAFLDVLAHLPGLQPEQRYDGFPNINSPMRPYTDHPFVGNVGDQDFSAYFASIIAEQDLQDLLLSPAYTKADKNPSGNAESNPTSADTSTNNLNKALPEDSWREGDSDQVLLVQRADDTHATRCSSGINTLQTDTGDDNREIRAQTNMVYSGADQEGSHLYSQYQLTPAFDPQTESQNNGAFCSASSWTPYPQDLFNTMVEPSRSDMINSDAFYGQGDWAAASSMQQLTVSEFTDPQQGTAARRIRLLCSVQRASASQPLLTCQLKSEDESGSCCSTGSSSNNHNEDYVDAASQTMVGDLMHIQGRGDISTQVVSLVEGTDKLQHLSLNEGILPHTKLPRGANLKQRLKLEAAQTTQNAHEGLPQNSNHVPGEPSLETRRQRVPTGSVMQLLWLALLVMAALLVLSGVWKSLNYWLV